jgi:oligo-1,6-glucosidase
MLQKLTTAACIAVMMLMSCNTQEAKKEPVTSADKKWWKEVVVYQIYPRSFKDSDGDGVGDLKGIIEKLDYIQSLGVNVVWLNPIYSSPNDDMGYDISDYRDIMKEFGTMADFDTLLKGMHDRGLKLVMDLVVNHTSDEHKWFIESRKSRDNPYRNYYHWWPAERGKPAKRKSDFDVNLDAWKLDSTTNAYYLHYFSRKQPDLNWENPKVRSEVFDLMKFWFDKGIDGFRMDVIPFISKDTTFPELPEKYNGNFGAYYASGPHLHDYLQEMNKEVLSKYDIMTVGEGAGVQIEDALSFVDEDRRELQTFYHFDHTGYGRKKDNYHFPDSNNRHLPDLKAVFSKWDSVFANKGWGTVYFTTHDQSRMVSRFGNDSVYREPSSKMLYTFLLSMRATPYLYNGDEIGMTNVRFKNIEDYRDIETISYYNMLKQTGGDLDGFIKAQMEVARDNSRTPMQWNAGPQAGFTTGTPWIKVNDNKAAINVEAAEKDPNSILNYVRKMIKIRKDNPVLIYGKYTGLDHANEQVYAYTRELDGKKVLVLLSFSDAGGKFILPKGTELGIEMINNYGDSFTNQHDTIMLKPWQAGIIELK